MRRESRPYLAAPITERELAGVNLGDSLDDVRSRLGGPKRSRRGKDPSEHLLILDYPGVGVILKDERVDALIANDGYVGEGPSGICVGMTWKDLVQRLPDMYFDGDRYVWRTTAWPTIELELGREGVRSNAWREEIWECEDPAAFVLSIAVTSPPPE